MALFLATTMMNTIVGVIPPELQNLSYGIYPNSLEYNTARFNFNKRFNIFPQAIFAPTTNDELIYVMQNIKKFDLCFSVRSGGHCFEPGSLSSNYVVDLSNFNSIIPNLMQGEVYIGAGCLLKNVIAALGAFDYAIPTGTCPSVGVTGLTLGGGIGLLNRYLGLTCDSVKSITFLTADLEIIEVNEANDPDLFWALRGGGNGSYGIVLGFTFNMHYIPEVTFYELIWEWDYDKIIPIMKAWQLWVNNLPANISSTLGIRHPNFMCSHPEETPPLVIRVFGLKVGPGDFTEWEKAFKDLKPSVRTIHGRYIDTVKFWSFESDLPFNKLKSRILMKPVTRNVMRGVRKFFINLEKHHDNFLAYFNFEAFGGNLPSFHTAFFPRDAFAWWEQAYYWARETQNEEVLTLSRKFYAQIPKEVSQYCYANIVDYDLGKRYLKAYYGDHVDRLIKIKNRVDPTNLFRWKQSIPLKKRHSHPYGILLSKL
jgi:hypothetical protein